MNCSPFTFFTDEYGSFLLLDFEGTPSWLAVKGQDEMESAFQIAGFSDSVFPAEMLAAMKNNEKILYLYDEEWGYTDDPAECEQFLYPAQKLMGRHPYYYALIKDPKAYDIKPDQVLSYKKYLNSGKSR
jgi:hypothetical protein